MSEQAHGHRHRPGIVKDLPPAAVRYLIVQGLGGSGYEHWQSRWQRCRHDCISVELGQLHSPSRAGWVAAIDRAVAAAPGRVALIGHSLGCLAIASWAVGAQPAAAAKITGALLVAPPDTGQQGTDLRLRRFAPVPECRFPFRTLVVASVDDPYATIARSRMLAESWGASFVNVGAAGHINAASALGDWPRGQALLAGLING